MTGRPTSLTPETAAKILEATRSGAGRRIAAQSAGVGRSTLLAWLARGRRERRGPYRDFVDALREAEAQAVIKAIQSIRAAADPLTREIATRVTQHADGSTTSVVTSAEGSDWRAAAWFLEKRYPQEFGTRRRELRELQKALQELTARIDELTRGTGPRLYTGHAG